MKENYEGKLSDENHRKISFLMQYALFSVRYNLKGEKKQLDHLCGDLVILPGEIVEGRTGYEMYAEEFPNMKRPFTIPPKRLSYRMIETPEWQLGSLESPDLYLWGVSYERKIKILPADFDSLHDLLGEQIKLWDHISQVDAAKIYFKLLPKETVQISQVGGNCDVEFFLTVLKKREIITKKI